MPARVPARSTRRRPVALYRKLLASLSGACAVPRGATVLVACSGGPDSLALLLGLTELAPRFGLRLAVAHLDHGARRDSAADAQSVARRARALGHPLWWERVDGPRALSARGLAGEDGLRVLRREFLQRARRRAGADFVALGHTADDQAETLLLRLARGTSIHGLSGMRARRGSWLRPLLEVTRAEVEEFLRARRVRARRDPSNRDLRHARNRIRLEVLPELRHLNPGAAENIAAAASRLGGLSSLLSTLGRRAFRRALAPSGPASRDRWPREVGEEGVWLVRARLLGYHPAIRESVLRHAWSRVRRQGPHLTRRHLRALQSLLERGVGRSLAHLPGRRVARLERGLLFLGPGSSPTTAPRDRGAETDVDA